LKFGTNSGTEVVHLTSRICIVIDHAKF